MRKRIALPALAMCLAFAGCEKKPELTADQKRGAELAAQALAIQPKQNTPDMAVKSWWELKDVSLKQMMATCELISSASQEVQSKLRILAGPDIQTDMRCGGIDTYQRSIEDVQIQSDTRAIVLARAKNITPPDDGASTDSRQQNIKDTGTVLRYTLERPDANTGWKISTVEAKAAFSSSFETTYTRRSPDNHIYVDSYFQ